MAKLSKIVKIVKIFQNCQNSKKLSKVVKNWGHISSSHWSNGSKVTSLQGCSLYAKSKSPWFLAVICRFLAVICGSLSVSVGSWRLYVGSWRSSAVPGGYLVLGVLLSCSGQLKSKLFTWSWFRGRHVLTLSFSCLTAVLPSHNMPTITSREDRITTPSLCHLMMITALLEHLKAVFNGLPRQHYQCLQQCCGFKRA